MFNPLDLDSKKILHRNRVRNRILEVNSFFDFVEDAICDFCSKNRYGFFDLYFNYDAPCLNVRDYFRGLILKGLIEIPDEDKFPLESSFLRHMLRDHSYEKYKHEGVNFLQIAIETNRYSIEEALEAITYKSGTFDPFLRSIRAFLKFYLEKEYPRALEKDNRSTPIDRFFNQPHFNIEYRGAILYAYALWNDEKKIFMYEFVDRILSDKYFLLALYEESVIPSIDFKFEGSESFIKKRGNMAHFPRFLKY